MTIGDVLKVTIYFWIASEIVLSVFRHAPVKERASKGRSSLFLIWLVIGASVFAAGALQGHRFLPLPGSEDAQDLAAIAVILLGVAIRWWAILTLGRFFTVEVAIREGHTIVKRGPYRWVRHPSYTGVLVSFLGLGVAFGNVLSLILAVVPATGAFLYRIVVEERALAAHFGDAWRVYEEQTRRLVPGVY